MREICTSGSVRGGDGNVPTYSAQLASRATATLAGRIASPEMLPGRGLLPQLKCSPVARRSGGGDEAAEHGDA
jgi:hypothetical protein